MPGTVTLSLEIELGWGAARLESSNTMAKLSAGRTAETTALETLLDCCDELDIPVSFDVVGHLLLESCDADHDCLFPGHFDIDPGTDVDNDPLFYAPDLVNRIEAAAIDHEICTHTFSHVNCYDAAPELVEWELVTAMKTHERFGLDVPSSLVPPWHAPPPRDVLQSCRIETIRTPRKDYERPSSKLLQYPWILAKTHPTHTPRTVEGVLESYCTSHPSLSALHLPDGRLSPSPVFQVLPVGLRQRVHRRYLESGLAAATATGESVHYWTHLFNLANDSQLRPVLQFLTTLAEYRDRGDVTIETMRDLPQTD